MISRNSYSYKGVQKRQRTELIRQIAEARRNVRSWPKWMRDIAYTAGAIKR